MRPGSLYKSERGGASLMEPTVRPGRNSTLGAGKVRYQRAGETGSPEKARAAAVERRTGRAEEHQWCKMDIVEMRVRGGRGALVV